MVIVHGKGQPLAHEGISLEADGSVNLQARSKSTHTRVQLLCRARPSRDCRPRAPAASCPHGPYGMLLVHSSRQRAWVYSKLSTARSSLSCCAPCPRRSRRTRRPARTHNPTDYGAPHPRSFNFGKELQPAGKLPADKTELPFQFVVSPVAGEKLAESYHGVFINVQYVACVEVCAAHAPNP